MDDVLKSLFVAIGFKADDASRATAEKSVKDYETAVVKAEKAIEDARWAGAKTEEEVAKLTRDTNLKLAKEALQKAKDEEARRVEADKRQAAAIKTGKERIGDFLKVVVGVGAAIEAAALGVHAGVVRMAQSFDALQFTGQRTGVTVRNIQAIGYAASQMGSSVEAGVGSLESFARTLRQSPGSYSLLERLGVKTTDASGAKRTADALFQDFGKALRNKPGYLQDAYLQDFGIDEKTGRALIGGLDKYTEEYNAKLKRTGMDPDKAAKDAAALQRTFGSLGASLDIIGQKVSSKLFEGENNAFQKFVDWLDDHGDQIAAVLSRIAQVVLEMAKALLEFVTSPEAKKWFETMLSAFGDFDKETGKFTANVDKMKVALGLLGAYVATSWVKKILDAFGGVGTGWKALLALFGLAATPAGLGVATAAIGAGAAAATAEEMPKVLKERGAGGIDPATGGAMEGNGFSGLGPLLKRGYRAVRRALGGGSAEAHGGDAASMGVGPDGQVIVRGHRYRPSASSAQGKANVASWLDFAQRPVDQGGLGFPEDKARAVVAGLQGESSANLNPASVGDFKDPVNRRNPTAFGTAQWRLDRAEGLRRTAEEMRTDWTDIKAQQAWMRKEMLEGRYKGVYRKMMAAPSGEGALRAYINEYENPADHDGAYAFRKPYLDNLRQRAQAQTAPPPAPSAPKPPVSAKDVFPNGISPVFRSGSLPAFTQPMAPSVSSSDFSRTSHITVNQGDVNVRGVDDPKRAAEHVGTVQGYRTSDLIRNLRSPLA